MQSLLEDRTTRTFAMTVRFDCPHCGGHLTAHSDEAGQSARCPTCYQDSIIPSATQPPALAPRVLLVDTETTGFAQRGPNGSLIQPRIVAITWFVGPADNPSERVRTFLVRPDGFVIPAGATAVHRITTERAREHGTSLAIVMQQLREDIATLQPQFVVAHNAAYDIPVVEGEFQRLGLPCPISGLRAICTMQTTTALCRIPRRGGGGFRWPKLQELHVKIFARPFDGAHDSSADVGALARCFVALYRSGFYSAEFTHHQVAFTPRLKPSIPADASIATPSGYVFPCNNSTAAECLQKQVFGDRADWPLLVAPGSLCFLYNYDTRHIIGVWRAVRAGKNLDAQAWRGAFPYQCQVTPMHPGVMSIPRSDFAFLSAGRIPNPLPSFHVADMVRSFQTRCR